MEPFSVAVLWIVIVGFVIAFILAFGIGANDVANSFGTSVGSGVLTIRQACWLATFCEVSGAVLIGYKVSDTMRKGILDPETYADHERELMLGLLSTLASSALWLLAATFLKLPISGTHSIVGSTIGFSLVARGMEGLQWKTLGTIVLSWFVSPVMSGLVSVGLYKVIKKLILDANNPLKAGLISLPLFYGVTLFINVFSIVHDGPKLLYMDNIPTWIAIVGSLIFGVTVAILVQLYVVPWQRRKILGHGNSSKPVEFTFGDSDDSSANSSPKRTKRPLSLVCDYNHLPAITETTELQSLNNQVANSPQQTTTNGYLSFDVFRVKNGATGGDAVKNQYKIDPKIVKKAEQLLGGKNGSTTASLDNTDLTITSLNYIDEYQNTINGRNLQNLYLRSPEIDKKDSAETQTPFNALKSEDTTLDLALPPNILLNNGTNDLITSTKNNKITTTTAKNCLENVESGISLDGMLLNNNNTTLSPNSSKVPLINSNSTTKAKEEDENVSKLFSFLQILTATFGSFAHGGNDVSNAIGPLIALWLIYSEGSVSQKSETPLAILIFGGVGISVGLWLWGRRVIETVGHDLTKITPSTGFTIEIGAAMTVLLASKIGLPISTTHCKVGSVVFVGYANAPPSTSPSNAQKDGYHHATTPQQKAVDWGLFRNIVYAWVVTVPVAALLSAGFMFILTKIAL